MSKRVPQEFIHSLLAKVDIVDVIGARVDLKKKGVNHSGRCPFHQEKTPSFSVSQPKQFYYCFGCGAHGNAIRFLMDYDKLEFLEAVEELAHSVGMEVPAISTGFVAEQSNDLDLIYQVLNEASLFYQKQLRQHPAKQEAINYMKGRGLTGETAKTFHLGFSPESWDALLSALGTTPQRVEALSSAGLIIRRENGQFYDRFRHRIMFPIRDRRGRVIGFGGRVLKPEEQPKYLNSPETPVFHKGHELYGLYEAKRSLLKIQSLIVVEGYMDVIALSSHGVLNVVATLGTATTSHHIELLLKQCRHLIFCFDGDRAGREAAWRALNVCLPFLTGDSRMQFLFLPNDEDPDSIIQKEGKEGFLKYLDTAQELSEFLLDTLSKDSGLASIEARANFTKACIPYLSAMPRGPYFDLFIQKVAELSRLSVAQIRYQLPSIKEEQTEQKKMAGAIAPSNLVESVISRVLQNPELATHLPLPMLAGAADLKGLLFDLFQYIRANPGTHTGNIIADDRFKSHHFLLAKLAMVEHPLPLDQSLVEIQDSILKLEAEQGEAMLDSLLEKSKRQELTLDEKEKINFLLRNCRKSRLEST